MIKSFKHKGLELYFSKGITRYLQQKQLIRIEQLLDSLDAAEVIENINLPGFGLHKLHGNKQGLWSIKVSANWRITFFFEDSHVFDVNLEDYH